LAPKGDALRQYDLCKNYLEHKELDQSEANIQDTFNRVSLSKDQLLQILKLMEYLNRNILGKILNANNGSCEDKKDKCRLFFYGPSIVGLTIHGMVQFSIDI